MDADVGQLNGACHCGAVRFVARLTDGLHTARRCNCSYCGMRGAIAVSADLDGFEIVSGADELSVYAFNTMTAKHYFCSRCGIYTHHQRRSNPRQYGINVACLERTSPFDFEQVPVVDGVRHPCDDAGGRLRVAGTLRYQANA